MKKMVKNGLIAILVVLMTLCLVSCGGLAGNDGSGSGGAGGSGGGSGGSGSGSGGSGGSGGGSDDVIFRTYPTNVQYCYDSPSRDTYTFAIIQSVAGYTMMLSYNGNAPDMTDTSYFSEVKFGGAAEALTPVAGIDGYYQAMGTKETKSELIQAFLPTTNSWIMTFRSSADSSRNKSHTISSTYVSQILDWLDEQ